MRRLFILCFALLLPLQFAWATAAAYCTHETGGQEASGHQAAIHESAGRVGHVGHHGHVHESGNSQPAGGTLVADADCGTCHAAGSMLVALAVFGSRALPASTVHGAMPPSPPIASAPTRLPDRPQWLRLA